MNLHEYQSKALLKKFGVPLLRGYLAYSPREAMKACENLGGKTVVVKAQVHAGGRGKAGGVKIARNPREALDAASQILGMKLVSPQTGPQGKLVRKIWIEEGADIAKEYYLSLIVDRVNAGVSFIISAEGGMEIETLAEKDPAKILSVLVRPECGLQDFHVRRMTQFLEFDAQRTKKFQVLARQLYRAFLELDCALLEVNPLIETKEGAFICLDAKVSIDDSALFRQPEADLMQDYDEIDEREIRAGEVGINYIALDGNIGCLVNGAGLAMATMDIIQSAGGKPANFLDVGGGATQEMVTEAFKLILQDSAVKGILVNIFGGIIRCDVIAEGIILAARDLGVTVPLVVRLQGTNVDLGKKKLEQSGLKIISADDMEEAGRKIVEAVKEAA